MRAAAPKFDYTPMTLFSVRKLTPPKISGPTWITRHIATRKLRATGPAPDEMAAQRIREWLCEQGMKEKGGEVGWMKAASEAAGIPYDTARAIIHGDKERVGLLLAKKFSEHTRCPLYRLYEV
jgi:hypothetical protein